MECLNVLVLGIRLRHVNQAHSRLFSVYGFWYVFCFSSNAVNKSSHPLAVLGFWFYFYLFSLYSSMMIQIEGREFSKAN